MAHITLIIGGSRSGKSEYARKRAESFPGPRLFVATCPALDDETRERIRAHRQARSKESWDTIEELTDIAAVVQNAGKDYAVLLVDCLTLWVNNLLHQALTDGRWMTESEITDSCNVLIEACSSFHGHIFLVANEVGMGIVPENAVARRFRDLAGRCNQLIAAAADEVISVSYGIPVVLKGENHGAS